MIVQLRMEIGDDGERLKDHPTLDLMETLHEALCRGLHEHDPEALAWLRGHVCDIGEIEEKYSL